MCVGADKRQRVHQAPSAGARRPERGVPASRGRRSAEATGGRTTRARRERREAPPTRTLVMILPQVHLRNGALAGCSPATRLYLKRARRVLARARPSPLSLWTAAPGRRMPGGAGGCGLSVAGGLPRRIRPGYYGSRCEHRGFRRLLAYRTGSGRSPQDSDVADRCHTAN